MSLLYPTSTTEVEMGQSLKGIVRVLDGQGGIVENARVSLAFEDPGGNEIASIPAEFGDGGVYRTEAWIIPHAQMQGLWRVNVHAQAGSQEGTASDTLQITPSTSEILLTKYGFWIDAPRLRGIVPTLALEQGDAQNGVIIWGGILPEQHIFPENWVEIQWREGDFKLQTPEEARHFMLATLGNLGFTPVREIGTFERTTFKDWPAWQVKTRGQYERYDELWVIFYAPEVNKTYAIATTVVQPPEGIDPHAALRDSFQIHPEIEAHGSAPKPLPRLLPPPELVSPELGELFTGTGQPIVLTWKPVKDLAQDEYYRISVDFNYEETNTTNNYFTRETKFTLPEMLYRLPNCGVFNWRVTLMKQTGPEKDGVPQGEAISFSSLYRYIRWWYPTGEEAPFNPLCLNPQT